MSQVLMIIVQPEYDSPSFRETDIKYYFILLAEFIKIAFLTKVGKKSV